MECLQGFERGRLDEGKEKVKSQRRDVAVRRDGSNLECAHFGEPTFFAFTSET